MTQLFGPVSPHEDGAQAHPGASLEEAALSSLPGGSCQHFAEDGLSGHEGWNGMEKWNGLLHSSSGLPLGRFHW